MRHRRVKDIENFTVKNLGQLEVIEDRKDVLLLDSKKSFEEIRDLLLLRARTRGILPAENESESIWPLVSVNTNRKALVSDIFELDHASWEAGRELLFTKEDAILRLDVAVISAKATDNAREKLAKKSQEKRAEKENKCTIQ